MKIKSFALPLLVCVLSCSCEADRQSFGPHLSYTVPTSPSQLVGKKMAICTTQREFEYSPYTHQLLNFAGIPKGAIVTDPATNGEFVYMGMTTLEMNEFNASVARNQAQTRAVFQAIDQAGGPFVRSYFNNIYHRGQDGGMYPSMSGPEIPSLGQIFQTNH
jgi:hypothetical protein